MEYKGEFSIEDFEAISEQLRDQEPLAIIVGSEEQIAAFKEKEFWPAMEKAAIVYLNTKTPKHDG